MEKIGRIAVLQPRKPCDKYFHEIIFKINAIQVNVINEKRGKVEDLTIRMSLNRKKVY